MDANHEDAPVLLRQIEGALAHAAGDRSGCCLPTVPDLQFVEYTDK